MSLERLVVRTIVRLCGLAAAGLAVIAVLLSGFTYASSERLLRRRYDVGFTSIVVRRDAAAIAEGRRLANIHGCVECHGENLEGRLFFKETGVARVIAPNLTRIAEQYSDQELERVIRHGVRRNGTGVFAMPSSMFYHLSDQDLGAIIGFVRSTPRFLGNELESSIGLFGRLGLLFGQFKPNILDIDHSAPRIEPDSSDPARFGRYLALTTCTECHGADLRGSRSGSAPDLAIVAAYSVEDLRRLMETGIGLRGRELGLMRQVARGRFRHFTDAEVAALHAYLSTLARI